MTSTKRRKRKAARKSRSQAGRLARNQERNAQQLNHTISLIRAKYGDRAQFKSHDGRKVRFTLTDAPPATIDAPAMSPRSAIVGGFSGRKTGHTAVLERMRACAQLCPCGCGTLPGDCRLRKTTKCPCGCGASLGDCNHMTNRSSIA